MVGVVALVAALVLGGAPLAVPLEGDWILLHLQDHDAGVFDLYLIHPDGSRLVNLTNGSADDYDAAVSPDGTMIAVSSNDGVATEIWVMSADGTGRRQVTSGGGYAVAWTPGGAIVYSRAAELRIVQPDGSGDSLIVDHGMLGIAANLSVSPDGSTVVFDVNDEGSQDIYSVPIAGGEVTRLTTEGGFEPEWSPDGTRIAFTAFRGEFGDNVWVMNPDGSDQRNLFPSEFNDFQPSWSPDGSQLVFESVRNEDFAITIHDLASGTNRDLITTPTNAAYRTPVWVKVTGTPGSGGTTTTTVADTTPPVTAAVTTTVAPGDGGGEVSPALIGLVAALLASGVIGAMLYRRTRSGAEPPPPPAV